MYDTKQLPEITPNPSHTGVQAHHWPYIVPSLCMLATSESKWAPLSLHHSLRVISYNLLVTYIMSRYHIMMNQNEPHR
jgi:hypothetical protein